MFLRIILLTFAVCHWMLAAGVNPTSNEHFQYLFLEALRQQEKGNFAGAFDLLQHCESLNPNASEIKFLLSKYYLNLKDMKRARTYMEKASELAQKTTTIRRWWRNIVSKTKNTIKLYKHTRTSMQTTMSVVIFSTL